jgi:hypothetical protein
MSLRRAVFAAAFAAIATLVAGLLLAFGPLRAVWLNAGLRIDYPWPRGASALVAAGGAAGLAALTRPRALRFLAAALSIVLGLVGAGLLLYRLEALDEGLVERRLLGTVRLAWSDVTAVQTEPEALLVAGAATRVRIDTTQLSPDQRASLERTIARRVREASASR